MNTSHARHAGLRIPNSAKEKTDCTSSRAIHAAREGASRLSRLVIRLKLGRERGNRRRRGSWNSCGTFKQVQLLFAVRPVSMVVSCSEIASSRVGYMVSAVSN